MHYNKMSKSRKCAGKEGFQRINYLHQVSNALATENAACNIASSLYSNLVINVSKKTVQRIDIDMKRNICKGCRSLLLAGITCKVRIKKKKVIWTCMKCRTSKVFDIRNRNYIPWTQRKESIVEVLDFGPQQSQSSTKRNESNRQVDTILVCSNEVNPVIPVDPEKNQQMAVDDN